MLELRENVWSAEERTDALKSGQRWLCVYFYEFIFEYVVACFDVSTKKVECNHGFSAAAVQCVKKEV